MVDTLTLAVVDVDDGILILQRLGNTADETLCAFGGGVDGDEVEGTLGSRHFDIDVEAKQYQSARNATSRGLLCGIGADFVATEIAPHIADCGWPGVEILRRS